MTPIDPACKDQWQFEFTGAIDKIDCQLRP